MTILIDKGIIHLPNNANISCIYTAQQLGNFVLSQLIHRVVDDTYEYCHSLPQITSNNIKIKKEHFGISALFQANRST
jgi:hypothetical protein